MRHFKVEFSYILWTCGDGCCSDSWHDVYLYELVNGKSDYVYSWHEVRGIRDEDDAREYAQDHIDSWYDLELGQYTLEIDYSGY